MPAAPAAAESSVTASAMYRQAQESFARQDFARALKLLDQAPETGSASDRADLVNLRGAIYLRQQRFEQAHQEFTRALQLDPGLWAARFNAAEVSFRQKQYAESRREFDALLDHTSRLTHQDERRFLQYKMALADLCNGQEKSASDFIAQHRADDHPPTAWYYLNAAIEQRHDRPQKAQEWLAQADARQGAETGGQMYAESFARLGWSTDRADRALAVAPARRAARRDGTATEATLAKTGGSRPHPKGESEPAAETPRTPPTTMAMVQIMPESDPAAVDKSAAREEGAPGAPKPNFRPGMPPAPADLFALGNLPPSGDDIRANVAETLRPERSAADAMPATLRKPTRKATPAPTPAPSASPSASAGPSPSPSTDAAGAPPTEPDSAASPSPVPAAEPPSPAFREKYDAAEAKFLIRDYPGAVDLLDEADKLQRNQPQSANLRTQIFKAYYGAAYAAFRKADYPAALEQLDGADRAQTVADSYNLRGLIQSKQRNYDQAETFFKKAFTTDPSLWAARFNYAELPFNYGNYTMARSRFENLLDQTNKSNQPRETELTQYKVFLTLLMEGKVDAASNFRDHLNFTGATPARFFCQAALDFHEGNVEKAKGWIDSAKKDFPPQLVSIFIESFYRLGWMSDPNAAQPGTALASASASPAPGEAPAPSPAGTAVVSSSPAAAPTASPLLAAASPAAREPVARSPLSPADVALPKFTPGAGLATPAASPFLLAKSSPTPPPPGSPAVVAASATPGLAAASPAVTTPRPTPSATAAVPPSVVPATPAPALVKSSATPLPTASATVPATSPVVAVNPSPVLPKASVTPQGTVSAVSAVSAGTPARTPATPTARPSATPAASATPEATPDEAPATATAPAKESNLPFQLGVIGVVLVYGLYNLFRVRRAIAQSKLRRKRRLAARRPVAETAP